MPIPSSNTSPITSPTPATFELCDKSPKKCNQSTDAGASSPSSASSSPVFSHHDSSTKQQKQHRSLLSSQRNTDSSWTDLSTHRLRNSQLGNLYAGSRFTGSQKCGDNKYDVVVDIQNVNVDESTLCGYLNIKGLTTEFPELTTYFEGEIIGPKYSFLTRKWQAQHYIDVAHWVK
ncbi:hypothetical protein [Absidia glauca]|uniref:Uncharacterized protein n=1 Tax=Absidia glauca TaxID=4829 RepID=A0A163IX13_ABSGL|nr:hypothetical protein [Absidia glauca]